MLAADVKRGKTCVSESRLVLVLPLIGWKYGANFLSQSLSVVMQNQSKREFLSTLKSNPPLIVPNYFITLIWQNVNLFRLRESCYTSLNPPVLPDPSLTHVGKIRRTKIFSVLAGPPKLSVFPQSSFSEHCSFITCISRDASLITVSAKNWGGDNIGAKGRLAATDTAAAARSWRIRLIQMLTNVCKRARDTC